MNPASPVVEQTNILLLHCSYCPFNTLLLTKFLSHLQTAHPTMKCHYKLHRCGHCNLTTTSYSLLVEHSVLIHHDLECSIECVYDSGPGASIRSQDRAIVTANNNSQTHIPLPAVQPNSTDLYCLFCPYETTQPKNLTIHYNIYHGIKNVVFVSTASMTDSARLKRGLPLENGSSVMNSPPAVSNNLTTEQPFFSETETNPTQTDTNQVATNQSDALVPSYTCSHCGNKYLKAKYFNEHVGTCSRAKNLSCPCGRVLKWRSNWYAHRKTCVIYNRMKALGMYPSRKANLNSGSPNAILSGSTYASNMPAYPNSSPTITGASSTPNGGPPPLAVNPPDFVNLFGGLDFTTFPVSLSASVPNEVVMPDANQAQLPSNTLSFCELNPTGSWATVNSAACAVANQHIQKEEDA